MTEIQEIQERLNIYRQRLYVAQQSYIRDEDEIWFYENEIWDMESDIALYELKVDMGFTVPELTVFVTDDKCMAIKAYDKAVTVVSVRKFFNWWRMKTYYEIKYY